MNRRSLTLGLALLGACDRAHDEPNPPMGDMPGMPGMSHPPPPAAAEPAPNGGADDIAWWTCPMHNSIHAAGPGSCPICGMTLVPVKKADLTTGAVTMNDEARALAGVELATATVRTMRHTVHAVGTVTWDQERLTDVTIKVDGYVREAFVAATGTRVRRGQALFSLYSPDVLVAEEELLGALAADDAGAAARAAAARRKLRLWDLGDAQIDRIVASGAALDAVPILSPVDGIVIEEDVVSGGAVERGARLYRLGDLRHVWIEAQIPETDVASVQVGQAVRVSFPDQDTRSGEVALVLPEIDPATRTATVRVELANDNGSLLPAEWASIDIDLDSGAQLTIPESAVLYTGSRRVVFVDVGNGRLEPRAIRIGARGDGFVAVEEGLAPGDRVVVSGNFQVAADSRIQSGDDAW
jgi:Cu(I)/Ag(I) efflux system membrane fusion protein